MSNDTVWQVYGDHQGMLWIAADGGISMLDCRAKHFYHYRAIPGNPNSLSNNSVQALYASREGIVLVGTNRSGEHLLGMVDDILSLSRIEAVTASVLEERHDEILACGCDEVVRKPFKDHEIFDSLTRHLSVKYLYEEKDEEPISVDSVNVPLSICRASNYGCLTRTITREKFWNT